MPFRIKHKGGRCYLAIPIEKEHVKLTTQFCIFRAAFDVELEWKFPPALVIPKKGFGAGFTDQMMSSEDWWQRIFQVDTQHHATQLLFSIIF
jgi:hypothetical protein